MKTISLTELTEKIQHQEAFQLIEALPARYFNQGHLPGAVNINIGEVIEKAATYLPDKMATLIVYCASQSCSNSDQVAMQLHALGYENISVFKGGKAAWLEAGLVLEQQECVAV